MAIRSVRVAGALLGALLLASSSEAQTLKLTSTGGATLGKLSTITVSGTPGDAYVLLLSLSTGPTLLPPPHQTPSLDVGLELVLLSFQIPGFVGVLDGTGKATAFLPFPLDVILLSLPPLNFQAVRIFNGKINGKSNLCRLVPALPDTTMPTLGEMSVLRAGHLRSTLKLDDGSVWVFGGGPDGNVASYGQDSVDRYDPCTQTFTQVGVMNQPRTSHTATRLLDGRILLVGGAEDVMGEPTKTAEIYDPATNVSINVPNMSVERALHTANRLADGRVIVMGGTSSFANPNDIIFGAKSSTEIYNPVSNSWSAGPVMFEPRVGHRTDALPDGRILVSGGYSWFTLIFQLPKISNSAQLYVPGGGTGTFGPALTMQSRRFGHNSLVIGTRVYLFGGATDQGAPLNPVAVDTVERFDPANSSFTLLPPTMSKARGVCALSPTLDGRVIVAGGSYGGLAVPTPDDSVDVFDPVAEAFTSVLQMQHVRSNFAATLLDDGTILLTGGGDDVDPQSPTNPISFKDAEILHP